MIVIKLIMLFVAMSVTLYKMIMSDMFTDNIIGLIFLGIFIALYILYVRLCVLCFLASWKEGYTFNDDDDSYDYGSATGKGIAEIKYDDEPINSGEPFFGFESLTDERGYMRDGKAEELVSQLEKAKKLGRMTDDRGFIIDEDYVLTRRDHYAPDEEWEEKRDDDD